MRRTGWLLAHVADPGALRGLAGVAEVEVLAGDGHVVRVRPRDGVDELALSRTLWRRADVRWAHPDLALRLVPDTLPDDPYVGDQWHLANEGQGGWTPGVDIDAETAWAHTTGVGGLIAVIDSGVQLDHPDLRVHAGWDYQGDDDDPSPDVTTDEAPHGTCVAGLSAASGDNGIGVAGVAYDADVYAIRLIGEATDIATIYEAFVEAVDAGAWVLNNSWGFGEGCPEIATYGVFESAIEYAETEGRDGLGAVVVASAGNDNCDIINDGFQAIPGIVSVAATNGDDDREGYSNYGEFVDVAAPSGGTLTTDLTGDDGYGSWDGDPDYFGSFSGTSASAPVVSGVLALMFAANPRLTAGDARAVLCDTAERIDIDLAGYDADGWSPYYGCGRVDAGAAVLAVANDAPAAPQITGPPAEVWVERVVLQWAPADDPDGDWLAYEVSWWIGDDEPDEDDVEWVEVDGTHLDLTGEVEAGDVVSWSVRAVDLWGAGEPSGTGTFTVGEYVAEELPEEAGCAVGTTGRGALGWVMALVLCVAWIRSRSRSRSR